MDLWRQLFSLLLLFFAALPVHSQAAGQGALVTCFKCLANDTNCRDTCTGKYCYKSELTFSSQKAPVVKKGCLQGLDSLSKIGECTDRPSQLPGGGGNIKEQMCICTSQLCNGSSSVWSSVAAFFTAVFAYLWKD